ncbi:hypothetical protein L3V83_03265 [Thiotrichales bacterium 19X7-9]|nr:hypothetical protein [Thiotrichales bacterium 19X7-9]
MKKAINNALVSRALLSLEKVKQLHKYVAFEVILNSAVLLILCLIFPLNKGNVLAIWLWTIWYACYYLIAYREPLLAIFIGFLILLLLANRYFIYWNIVYSWYFASFILVVGLMLKRILKVNALIVYLTIYYFCFAIVYYAVNRNNMGFLYSLKYYFVNIFMVFVLYCYLQYDFRRIVKVCLCIFSIVLFFALVQYLGNYIFAMRSNPFNFNLRYLELRPASFFSETTWVAECAVLFVLLAMYAKKIQIISSWLLWLMLVLSIVIFVITTTRAAYLALIIVCLFNFRLWNIRIVLALFALSLSSILIFYLFNPTEFLTHLSWFYHRLHFQDGSAQGRYQAIILTVKEIIENPWALSFGHGFIWNAKVDVLSSGTAMGAKAFSILLFIPYVFGIFGVFIFLLLLLKVFLRYQKLCRLDFHRTYGASIFLAYLVISSVAPLFQYSLGVIWLALALGILFHENNDES